jgi:hypothetical protein
MNVSERRCSDAEAVLGKLPVSKWKNANFTLVQPETGSFSSAAGADSPAAMRQSSALLLMTVIPILPPAYTSTSRLFV